jgi:CheY-like chemotaxis protein
VRADPARRIRSSNIVSNAIKFTPEGGRVEIGVARAADEAEVTVRDTGIGIAPDVLARVFERFEQADSSIVRRQRGLGLGLAIARHLVELHGGTITAESEGMQRGSTFRVRLPLEATADVDAASEAPAGEHVPRAAGPLPRLTGLRVVVVDDEPDARDFVSTLLSAYGATVTAAASAAEALRALAERRPDVLVADLAMPEEDGYALIRKIAVSSTGARRACGRSRSRPSPARTTSRARDGRLRPPPDEAGRAGGRRRRGRRRAPEAAEA